MQTTIEVHTINPGSQNRSIQKAKANKKSLKNNGKINNPKMKRKVEASERMLTEKEASQLSDTEFKTMVLRKPTELLELKENCQKLQGNYNELTANYINMKKK